MKKRRILLSVVIALGLMLTACGDFKGTTGSAPSGNVADTAKEESQETEKLPPSQEYVSSDGSYKVILLEGLKQSDMTILAGTNMMVLEDDSKKSGLGVFSARNPKSNVYGKPDGIESLEDYANHMENMVLNGSNMTADWKDVDVPTPEGAKRCLVRESALISGASKGQAYGYYLESENNYFSVFVIGNADDVEEAKQVIALEILDDAAGQSGTKGFINGMTAVLDTLNGASVRETFHALEEAGASERQLETLASQSRQSLSSSWGVESNADLMEMADYLIYEGHNQNALEFLEEYGGTGETDRDTFDAKLTEQGMDEGTYISLMAAYDAWSAYGESAISAWDLSRVGTIMGFGYAAGYCTYEEAMDKTLEAAEKAQELFSSWEDFNQSYLYGYSYWSEESLDDPESSAAERAEMLHDMETQANGPFAPGWDIQLTKEW